MDEGGGRMCPSIPDDIVEEWQRIVDTIARLTDVPVALIMRADRPLTEVFRANLQPEHPFTVGDRADLAEQYCEQVVDTRAMLLVPDAKADPKWATSPDAQAGLVSYLGFPLLWPDREAFGVLCVMDRQENHFGDVAEELMSRFRSIIECHLGLVWHRRQLNSEAAERLEHEAALRARAERELGEAESLHRSLLESIASPVIAIDDHLTITCCNRAYRRLSGLVDGKLEGRSLLELNPNILESKTGAAYRRALATGEPQEVEGETGGRYFRGSIHRIPQGAVAIIEDVTDRRRAEERLRLAAEVATDLIYEWDVAADTLEWHGNVDAALGHEPGEIAHNIEAWVTRIHPEDQGQLADAVERHRTAKEPIHYEYRIRHKDGSWRAWLDRAMPTLGAEGLPVRWVGTCADVTEQREGAAALRESEERFRGVFEQSPVGIAVLSLTGKIERVNAAMCAMLGHEPEELVSRPAASFIAPADREVDREGIRRLMAGETDRLEVDTQFVRRDGSTVWARGSVSPVLDEAGRPRYAVAVIEDASERRRYEQALENAAREWRATFDSISDGLMVMDASCEVVRCNRAMAELLGRPIDEVLGGRCFELVHHADSPVDECPAEVARVTGRRESAEMQVDGRWYRVAADPVLDDAGKVISVVHTMSDITELKEAEKRQEAVSLGLRAVLETADEFMACANLDTLHRRAVELAREKLGVERCSLFLIDDEWVTGTYGTDMTGCTTDERSWRQARADYWEGGSPAPPHDGPRWERGDAPAAEWDGADYRGIGGTWVVLTPVSHVDVPLGIFYNDTAITGAPLDEVQQDVFAVYASLVGSIIEQKRAEGALRESEAGLERAQQIAHLGNWQRDAETGRVSSSPEMRRIFGVSPEGPGADDEGFLERVHPDDRSAVEAALDSALRSGERRSMEYRIVLPDGSVKWVQGEVDVTIGPDGSPVRLMGTVHDTTARKLAEKAIRESEERFRALIENAHDVIYVIDETGTLTYAAPSVIPVMGYDPEDVIGRSAMEFIHPEDLPIVGPRLQNRLREPGVGEYIEFRLRHADGSWRDVEVVATNPGPDSPITGAVANIRDVTDRKKLEEHLRQSTKLESLGTLAGGVAHDFNNILTGILGYSDMLLTDGAVGADATADLRSVRSLAERAAGLTRQLLMFSRQQAMERVSLDVNGLVEDLARMLRRIIGEDMEAKLDLASDLEAVRADPSHVEQILMNLAVNARDAMPRGGTLTIETANVELDEAYAETHPDVVPGRYVMVSVSDTGSGMDAATIARAFEPFFTTKEVGQGTGLGLAMVYGIVRQHEGGIELESEPGRGTTFRIYLPAAGEQAGPETPSTEAPTRAEGSEVVLVVDDEDTIGALVSRALTARGYTVHVARDPVDAQRRFEELAGEVDLLVTDVVMPRGTGPELHTRLAAEDPSLKVLYMSGYTEHAVIDDHLLAEDTPFLQKPFSPGTLALKVRQALDGGSS